MEKLEVLYVVLTICFLILSLGIHEAAHAWVANLRGDSTAKDLGRLTLNPVAHIDPIMTILLPAVLLIMSGGRFCFGGARPVPVNAYRLKHPLRDMMLVALAGPASNFLLAVLFAFVAKALEFSAGMPREALAVRVMDQAFYLNLILAAFNMLPVPPLDGSRVLAYVLPGGLRDSYVGLERFGMLVVLLLLATGTLNYYIFAAMTPLENAVDFLTSWVWA